MLCTFPRHWLVTRTGETQWVDGPCGVPLFGSDKSQGSYCRSCRNGWASAGNIPLQPQAVFLNTANGRRYGLWCIPGEKGDQFSTFVLRDVETGEQFNSHYSDDGKGWFAALHDALQGQGFLMVPETGATSPSVPAGLLEPLASKVDAERWIEALHDAGLSFHFDDSPETITRGGSGESLFTDDEAEAIRQRVRELYAFEWGAHDCPIGYAIHARAVEQARREFPRVPSSSIPALPISDDEFVDASWHNDASPHFLCGALGLSLWIEHPDPEQREPWGDDPSPRYALFRGAPFARLEDMEEEPEEKVYSGESFAACAVAMIREAFAGAARGWINRHVPEEWAKLWRPYLAAEGFGSADFEQDLSFATAGLVALEDALSRSPIVATEEPGGFDLTGWTPLMEGED
jgi:hypothetical protein